MIARAIVKAHGGSINAESTGTNHGTTVIVDLPIILIDSAAPVET